LEFGGRAVPEILYAGASVQGESENSLRADRIINVILFKDVRWLRQLAAIKKATAKKHFH
jgi:hypothetical protein